MGSSAPSVQQLDSKLFCSRSAIRQLDHACCCLATAPSLPGDGLEQSVVLTTTTTHPPAERPGGGGGGGGDAESCILLSAGWFMPQPGLTPGMTRPGTEAQDIGLTLA
jgi:hypothetical protein